MEETKTLQEEYSPTDAKREKVRRVAVAMIDDFPEHPFKVKDDEEMEKLKDSIGSAGESDLRIKDSTLPQISDPDVLIQIFRHGDSYGAVRKKLCLWAVWFFVIDNVTELWYNMK